MKSRRLARGFADIRTSFLDSSSRPLGKARLNGRENLVVGWKAVQILLRDALITDPDRELAAAPFDQLGLDTDLILNERRHTDSARAIVSNLAVPNSNAGH